MSLDHPSSPFSSLKILPGPIISATDAFFFPHLSFSPSSSLRHGIFLEFLPLMHLAHTHLTCVRSSNGLALVVGDSSVAPASPMPVVPLAWAGVVLVALLGPMTCICQQTGHQRAFANTSSFTPLSLSQLSSECPSPVSTFDTATDSPWVTRRERCRATSLFVRVFSSF
jgi:hypothetical protein